MSPPPSTDAQSLRLVLVIAVLVAVLHPLWARLVDEAWDGLLGPRSVRVVDMPAPVLPPPAAAAAPASEPDAGRREPESVAVDPAPHGVTEPAPTPVARAIAAPEVLGVSVGSGEPQVLLDLRGHADPGPWLDEICVQAQRFVDAPLTGRSLRLLAHEEDADSRELGRFRCR